MSMRTLRFQLVPDGASYAVSLTVDGGPPAHAPFLFDVRPGSRVNSVIAQMAVGPAQLDDLCDVGTQLLRGLLDGEVGVLFDRARDEAAAEAAAAQAQAPPGVRLDPIQLVIRLAVPPALQHLPWECLYDDERRRFLLSQERYCLIRDTPDVRVDPRVPRRTLPISVLAVIPEGSNLNVEREMHGLKVAVDKLGDAIELQRLDGSVTPDRLREKLDSRPWDIVHFIGHGDVVNDLARIRLNSENPQTDRWMTGEVFATFFEHSVPRLVVLNCCFGGSQSPQRTLSGIGPFLIGSGVPAVVAMQYEIPDDVAIKFAESFYGELLGQPFGGRVDLALAAARRALFQNQRPDTPLGFATPVLYQLPGNDTIFELAMEPPAPEPVTIVGVRDRAGAADGGREERTPGPVLPAALLDALRDRRCVPVVGADVLRVGGMRATPPPPGPRELAQALATEVPPYPRMEDFRLSDLAAETSGLWLLQTVCQYYERANERYRLLMAVQKVYKDFAPPPAATAIAAWNVPGIICTYFDGLIEEAMTRQHRTYRTLTSVDQRATGYRGETLIVHLRGVFTAGDSLVLTEGDHDALYDRMAKISPDVTDLTRKQVGLSLLYLGVSPRDPLIRRLTRALRGDGKQGTVATQGPMYFVCPDQTEVDDAYWNRYNVRWLRLKLDDFFGAIAEAAPGGVWP